MADEDPFENDIAAVDTAMTSVHNAQFFMIDGDPRNLNPEDEPLEDMYVAVGRLEEKVDDLREAVRAEMKRRESALDAMSEKELDAWEKSIA